MVSVFEAEKLVEPLAIHWETLERDAQPFDVRHFADDQEQPDWARIDAWLNKQYAASTGTRGPLRQRV